MLRILLTLAALLLNTLAFAADHHPASRIEKDLQEARRSVSVDLSELEPGQFRRVDYASDVIWVYRRTAEDLEYLRAGQHEHLANPDSAGFRKVIEDQHWSSTSETLVRLLLVTQPRMEKSAFRSEKDEFLVVRASGPLGCVSSKSTEPV